MLSLPRPGQELAGGANLPPWRVACGRRHTCRSACGPACALGCTQSGVPPRHPAPKKIFADAGGQSPARLQPQVSGGLGWAQPAQPLWPRLGAGTKARRPLASGGSPQPAGSPAPGEAQRASGSSLPRGLQDLRAPGGAGAWSSCRAAVALPGRLQLDRQVGAAALCLRRGELRALGTLELAALACAQVAAPPALLNRPPQAGGNCERGPQGRLAVPLRARPLRSIREKLGPEAPA